MPRWFCGRWECTTGGHNKFYEIHAVRGTNGEEFECTYGAIGTAGTTIIKDLGYVLKKVDAMAAKRYVHVRANSPSQSSHQDRPTPKQTVVPYRSRLDSIGGEEGEKPEQPKKEEKPKPIGRLGSI